MVSFFENSDQLFSGVISAVNKVLKELKQKSMTETTSIPFNGYTLSPLLIQKPSLFRGEKSFFVGRKEYINKIRAEIKIPSSRVCIVGPGGSGKSQLAFKAIHQYEKEGLFDLVIPIYFSNVASMSFSDFLLNIAKSLFDINDIQVFEKMDIESRKIKINSSLSQRKHPLLFLDNYETVSYTLNNESQYSEEQYDEL